MKNYSQIAHNQATLETLQCVKQLMKSHYNIALLADFEGTTHVSVSTPTAAATNTTGADPDNKALKFTNISQLCFVTFAMNNILIIFQSFMHKNTEK